MPITDLAVSRGSGARERFASYSPDGKKVVYVTDASGEEAIAVADDAPDSALVAQLAGVAPGAAYARDERPRGGFRVVQLVTRNATRVRPFEEARTYVARDLAAQQAETLLTTRMAAARKALVVTLNDRAIARLTLEP